MRLCYFDSLKGVGALIVFFSHYNLAFNLQKYDIELLYNSPLSFVINGNWAVCLFIILSSFSITFSLYKNNLRNLKSIIIKRYFRLTIPIAVVLFISYLLSKLGLYYNADVALVNQDEWLSGFYNSEICLYDFIKECFYVVFTGESCLDSPLWMINYIFIGTFLTILVTIAIHDLPLKKKILILTCLSMFFFKLSGYYSCVVLGIMLYDIYTFDGFRRYFNCLYIDIVLFIVVILLPFFYHTPLSNTISAFLLLFLILSSERMQHLLSNAYTLFLGKVSYQFYLLHWPILCSFSCFVFIEFNELDPILLHIIVFTLTLAITLFVSWVVTEYLEPLYNLLTKRIITLFYN